MNHLQLFNNIVKKKSFLCVGLDTEIEKLPPSLLNCDNPVLEFNRRIIDATHKYAVAFKPNVAFYEYTGAQGWITLQETVKYLRENYPDIFIIADAKRGDIGNTSKMYAKAFFENMDCDAVTVAPYMGEDSVKPFLSYSQKWVILLATSLGGAGVIIGTFMFALGVISPADIGANAVRVAMADSFWWLLGFLVLAGLGFAAQVKNTATFEVEPYENRI